jgi:hypothetical protein
MVITTVIIVFFLRHLRIYTLHVFKLCFRRGFLGQGHLGT